MCNSIIEKTVIAGSMKRVSVVNIFDPVTSQMSRISELNVVIEKSHVMKDVDENGGFRFRPDRNDNAVPESIEAVVTIANMMNPP